MVNIFFISILYSVSSTDCFGIALGGGGAFGAYQAGSFSGLINNLPANQVLYDVISGISVGALNGGAISQFPIGKEKPASDFILNLYQTFNGSQTIFKDWPGGIIEGLLFQSGIYDTSPERTFINNNFLSPSQRKFTLGATNIALGEYQAFNESLSFVNIKQAAMCSSAVSFFFETQKFEDGVYSDGGCTYLIDVASAVERCFEITNVESQITIDILSCYRYALDPAEKLKSLDVFYRAHEIRGYTKSIRYLLWAMQAYPGINFRYYLEPSQVFPSSDTLNFNKPFLLELINLGVSDAVNVINNSTFARKTFEGWSEYKDIIYV